MTLSFGTDGIRGVANRDLTPEFVLRLGRAIAHICTPDESNDAPLLIGRDTRCSGPMLEAALIAGMLSTGRSVRRIGIVPTPAVAALTPLVGASAGVMISASHNPIEDNGFKVFDAQGYKCSESIEQAIHDAIDNDTAPRPTHARYGRVEDDLTILSAYRELLLRDAARLTGITVVVDAAYGAAWELAPALFTELGARVIALHAEPDGSRINVECGATHLAPLAAAVAAEAKAHHRVIGVAFDGDADRVRFVDERGTIVDGDITLLALADDLHRRGALPHRMLVGTVMSNFALERECQERGMRLYRTPVGDRAVLAAMRQQGAVLGGEPSGHVIDLRRGTSGDGIGTAIALLSLLVREDRRLADLATTYQPYPQVLLNVPTRRRDLLTLPSVRTAIDEAERILGAEGRILVRPSGTEPLLRIMVEGKEATLVHRLAAMIAEVVRRTSESSFSHGKGIPNEIANPEFAAVDRG